jgi:hypothetical protein
MTPAEKLSLVVRMTAYARQLALAGLSSTFTVPSSRTLMLAGLRSR